MASGRRDNGSQVASGRDRALERGHRHAASRNWADAFHALSDADRDGRLDASDLELLATTAYLIGKDAVFLDVLDRAYHARLAANEALPAARCAFWLGLTCMFMGQPGRANGWLAALRRLTDAQAEDCAEAGYALLPLVEDRLHAGDFAAAFDAAHRAAAIGDRFADIDLASCARHLQGRVRLRQGRIGEGLELLDEAMIAVTAERLSPMMTGLVYCSVIEACQQVYALARAWEWTSALAEWCAAQPQMVAFTSSCLVHRAEILQFHGAWPDAIAEAQRAAVHPEQDEAPASCAAAYYRQGEVHRLRGEHELAETAYRNASRRGHDPQPGLALLRLTQGRTDVAAVAIRRAISADTDPMHRARHLPACVEILIAAGDLEGARAASEELTALADRFDATVLQALAAQARGAVGLAEGDAEGALGELRQAFKAWQQVEAPYEAARVRVLIAAACRAFGDDEGAELELEAARAVFERLGAATDLARIEELAGGAAARPANPLTPRETQVLRLVADGKTNKAIAAELSLSERTVDRHVSNIFDKLGVPSRAAATARAYEQGLI